MEPEQHIDDRAGLREPTQATTTHRTTSVTSSSTSQEQDPARVLPLRPRRAATSTTHTQPQATAGRDPLARVSPPPASALHRQESRQARVALSETSDPAGSAEGEDLSIELADPRVPSALRNVDFDTTSRTDQLPVELTTDVGRCLVRLSVRTALSRIDLELSEGCTFAETLETVLDLCPKALQDNAVAHGGWSLRTAAGRRPDGESTLGAAGVLDGATLFLVGIDPGAGSRTFDDVADAVGETVQNDASQWSSAARRGVALGAAGLFAALACLPLMISGPPWIPISLVLTAATVIALVAAGVVARVMGDTGTAGVAGLISVATGAAAATVATAGQLRLLEVGTAQLLLGAVAATVCASTAALVIGAAPVPLAAVIAGGPPTVLALGCNVVVDLPPVGGAAVAVGLCLGLMPLVPSAALRWARLAPAPVPTTVDEVHADTETVDAARVQRLTRRAVDHVTAMIQGLSWPCLAATAVLACSQDVTAQVLTVFAAAALLLRARLVATVGQRLPLLLAGIGSMAALLLAVTATRVGMPGWWWSAVPAVSTSVACLWLANRRRRPSPSATRLAEIADLIIATAIIPLVFGVLGIFGFVRGLAG